MKYCTPASFLILGLSLALSSAAQAQAGAAQPAPPAPPTAPPVPPTVPPTEPTPLEEAPIEQPEEPTPVEQPEQDGPELTLPEDDPADTQAAVPEVTLPKKDVNLSPLLARTSSNAAVTIAGYGEIHYNAIRPESGPMTNEVDFHRLVLYVGRQFNERLRFATEIEVEHAIVGDGKVGEVSVEQAFVDYDISKNVPILGELTLRTGIVLVPMGIVNQWHEPPLFHGVERPAVDKVIIPSTWREAGMGIVGKAHDQVRYELYAFSGLNPLKYSRGSGLRGGRQKGGEARTDGLAFSGRLQYEPTTQTVLGVSGYFSQSGKNADAIDANVPVLGVSADARTKIEGFELRALFAMFTIGDTDELNALQDADGAPVVSVADRLIGGYGEVAYDVLRSLDFEAQLLPFGRLEYYSTDPDDKTRAITDIVLGLSYRPISQVVFKQDVTIRRRGGDVDGDNATILNLGMGFLY